MRFLKLIGESFSTIWAILRCTKECIAGAIESAAEQMRIEAICCNIFAAGRNEELPVGIDFIPPKPRREDTFYGSMLEVRRTAQIFAGEFLNSAGLHQPSEEQLLIVKQKGFYGSMQMVADGKWPRANDVYGPANLGIDTRPLPITVEGWCKKRNQAESRRQSFGCVHSVADDLGNEISCDDCLKPLPPSMRWRSKFAQGGFYRNPNRDALMCYSFTPKGYQNALFGKLIDSTEQETILLIKGRLADLAPPASGFTEAQMMANEILDNTSRIYFKPATAKRSASFTITIEIEGPENN